MRVDDKQETDKLITGNVQLKSLLLATFYTILGLSYLCANTNALAQDADKPNDAALNEFIKTVKAKTYDCPDAEMVPQIEAYLGDDRITFLQRTQLQIELAHSQMCEGKTDQAATLLDNILSDNNSDKSAEYYASTMFLRGLIYDIQENPKRCELYQSALALSQGKFNDVSLSATLGLMSTCDANSDSSVKLGKLYSLVETYTELKDEPALATIHNNIGIMYGQLGQHVLAAEQYMKGYELGFEHYNGSNKLSLLISAISSYMASDMFSEAEGAINEFRKANKDIATPLTNFWQYFAESGYYYRTQNFPELAISLDDWASIKDDINNSVYEGLYQWYKASSCIPDNDIECLQEYLKFEEGSSSSFKGYTSRNKDYLKFKVDLYLALDDLDGIKIAYEHFAEKMFEIAVQQQNSGKVLGVANLHSKILDLEVEVESAEKKRVRTLWVFAAVILFTFVIFGEFIRRRQLARLSIDPVSQLLNSKTALAQISKIETPSKGKVNALAIFDLANFREVNRLIGAAKGDTVLLEIAQIFKQVTRDSDILGRLAPEQFILCLTDIEEEIAKSFFDRVHQALENTALGMQKNQQIIVRSSMSIFISHERFDDLNDILDQMLLSLTKNKYQIVDRE